MSRTDNYNRGPRQPQGPPAKDLESKLMEVGEDRYYIDLKQKGDFRYVTITHGEGQKYSSIQCSIAHANEFCSKIADLINFTPSGQPKDKENLFSVSFNADSRIFYFDIKDETHAKISCLNKSNRYTIIILIECLPNLLEIIQEFEKKYPKLESSTRENTGTERRSYEKPYERPTYGRNNETNYGRNNVENKNFDRSYDRRNNSRYGERDQGDRTEVGRNFDRNSRGRGNFQKRDNFKSNQIQYIDAEPAQIVKNGKTYKFQLSQSENEFLRITEILSDERRMSIQVPCSLLKEFSEIIGKIAQTSVSASPALTSPAPSKTQPVKEKDEGGWD